MNHYTFELTAQHRPEILERVLRVIRLRGFTVTNMDMALVDTQVQLKITVKSDRTFDLLVNQLAKLPSLISIAGKIIIESALQSSAEFAARSLRFFPDGTGLRKPFFRHRPLPEFLPVRIPHRLPDIRPALPPDRSEQSTHRILPANFGESDSHAAFPACSSPYVGSPYPEQRFFLLCRGSAPNRCILQIRILFQKSAAYPDKFPEKVSCELLPE